MLRIPNRHRRHDSRRVRTAGVALATGLVLLATVGLAACGGGSSSSATAAGASANGPGGNDSGRLKFAQCMRKQGVNIPDPTGDRGPPAGGSGIDRNSPQFQAAFKVCGKNLANAFRNVTPAQRQEFQAAMLKFAKCLRGQGLNVQDPQFNSSGSPTSRPPGGGGGGPGGFLRGLNRNDPKTQTALKACQSNLPQRPGGAPPGP